MVATARTIKKEHPNAKVVFIGPCAAKKLEAMRRSVRSDVDFVVTFEELQGSAIEKCVNEYYPGVEVKIEHAEGLADCKKILSMAKIGRMNGCLIEGMGCPGGCVAGAGTNIPVPKAQKKVQEFVKASSKQLPPKELGEIELK